MIWSIQFGRNRDGWKNILAREKQQAASMCIGECHIEQLLQETKSLLIDSLNELLKALIFACQSSLAESRSKGGILVHYS